MVSEGINGLTKIFKKIVAEGLLSEVLNCSFKTVNFILDIDKKNGMTIESLNAPELREQLIFLLK